MFTRHDQLQQKGGPEERFSFINKLKDEYTTTKSLAAKQQVLANLANFAYDPINFPFIKQLQIVDIFLNQLKLQENEQLCIYAVGGLCNLCNDPEIADRIVSTNGISTLSEYVNHRNKEIALNALTTLYYLAGDERSRLSITTPSNISKVLAYYNEDNNSIVVDPRLSNLATIFLHDLCDARQIEAAKVTSHSTRAQANAKDYYNISLPTQPNTPEQ